MKERVTVAAFGGVTRVTSRLWGTGEDISLSALKELTARYLDQMDAALVRDWRTP
jgi:hypothetical protein